MSRLQHCTTCHAAIEFRYTPAGARMPLDLEDHTDAHAGMYVVVGDDACRPAEPMFDPAGTVYRTCHFDTCTNAAPHRRR